MVFEWIRKFLGSLEPKQESNNEGILIEAIENELKIINSIFLSILDRYSNNFGYAIKNYHDGELFLGGDVKTDELEVEDLNVLKPNIITLANLTKRNVSEKNSVQFKAMYESAKIIKSNLNYTVTELNKKRKINEFKIFESIKEIRENLTIINSNFRDLN